MSKNQAIKLKNELIKRQYLRRMSQAEGYSGKTIDAIEKALWKYEEFTNQDDYATFSSRRAEQFKHYLKTHKNPRTGMTLGLVSQYHCLRHIKKFFQWLSGQPGYKTRISPDDVAYLQLGKKERQEAISSKPQEHPTVEQVIALCNFSVNSEIDRRDRALIAFCAISGMRDRAIVSLPIGCFNPLKLVVIQDPARGVQTKFSKSIETTLLRVNESLVRYVTDWYAYLVEQKKYSITDPFFPSTEMGLVSRTHMAFEAKGVSRSFWADAGPMRKIFKDRSRQTNMPYFSPHKFRHFIIHEAGKHISNIEQFKALSQNMGHSHMGTTFHGYGSIDTFRVNELVTAIDFSKKSSSLTQEELISQVVRDVLKNQNEKAV